MRKKHVTSIAPAIFTGILLLSAILFLRPPDVEGLIGAAESEWIAVPATLFLFALRSVIFAIPEPIIFIALSLVYRPGTALILGLAGVLVSLLAGYLIGSAGLGRLGSGEIRIAGYTIDIPAGSDSADPLRIFFLRLTPVIPNQLVSMALGAAKCPFGKYLVCSFLGLIPRTVSYILLGESISNGSAKNLLPSAITVLLSTILGVSYFASSALDSEGDRRPSTPQKRDSAFKFRRNRKRKSGSSPRSRRTSRPGSRGRNHTGRAPCG